MNSGTYCEIGANAQVDADVALGHRYPNDSRPLTIGDHAIIRSGTVIYANTTIGRYFTCGHQVLVRAEVTIGDRVVILHKTTLEGRISIGSGVKIMAHVYIPSATKIGNMVFVGPGTTFLNSRFPMRVDGPVDGAIIEDHAVIGGGVTICPGVRIGRGAFIGAGSVVVNDIPPYSMAYGNPARVHDLPGHISRENISELMLSHTDLWGGQTDESWRDEQR